MKKGTKRPQAKIGFNKPRGAEIKPQVSFVAELDDPKLAVAKRKDRAHLLIQSPTRIFLYWSLKTDPYQILKKAFPRGIENFTLAVKLVNTSRNTEEIRPVEMEGDWWFSAEPNCEYQAEIGFYSPNSSFLRILFSNSVHTPRRQPSAHRDFILDFDVNADQFSDVLGAAGYERDAVEVALAGDDPEPANQATRKTYHDIFGQDRKYDVDSTSELRFALIALAKGFPIADLQSEISPGLFDELSTKTPSPDRHKILSALSENFELFTEETIEEIGETVFGASAINFPRRLSRRTLPKSLLLKPNPISSFGGR